MVVKLITSVITWNTDSGTYDAVKYSEHTTKKLKGTDSPIDTRYIAQQLFFVYFLEVPTAEVKTRKPYKLLPKRVTFPKMGHRIKREHSTASMFNNYRSLHLTYITYKGFVVLCRNSAFNGKAIRFYPLYKL